MTVLRMLAEAFGALGAVVLCLGAAMFGWERAHPAVGIAAGLAVFLVYALVQWRRVRE